MTGYRITADEDARRHAAYDAAPGDKEAARLLGIDKQILGQWRRRAGLPSKRHRGTVPLPMGSLAILGARAIAVI